MPASRVVFHPPLSSPSSTTSCRALFRGGQLWFYLLEVDGKPVAAKYELVSDRVLYAYQTGVDPGASEHAPGTLINMAILRKAIGRGRQVFDFLRGDEPYKACFGTGRGRSSSSALSRAAPWRSFAIVCG